MYGLELILIIFATLAQALSSDSRAISIVGLIIFWRVLMGIGSKSSESLVLTWLSLPHFQVHLFALQDHESCHFWEPMADSI